jgi:hypothetical protein
VKLGPEPGYGSAIALYGGDVYWTVWGELPMAPSSVMRVPIDGGTPQTLVSNASKPTSLAVAAAGAFWTVPDSPGRLMTVPLAGGTATTIAVGDYEGAVATDGVNLYWTGDMSVFARALAGGSTSTLAVSSHLRGSTDGSIAVDSTSVYVAVNLVGVPGTIVRVPIGGGQLTTIASEQSPLSVAVDATNVYWTNDDGAGGSVARAPLGGGAPTTLSTGPAASGIAVDGSSVYWTNEDGTVMSVPVAGGTPTTLASDQQPSPAIAVDSTSVYWLSSGGVMKLTPK